MPWHVVVRKNRPKKGESWLWEDRVFWEEDYPTRDAMIDDVQRAGQDLEERYPEPDYSIASGSGPPPEDPRFRDFANWLFSEE